MCIRNICWEISRSCVWLTYLLRSCANCLDILRNSNFCKTRCLSRPVQEFLHLFVNIENVMELRYLRIKMSLMYSTEGFYIYKGTSSNKQVSTKLKELLHFLSWLLEVNHPEWLQWWSQIPSIFFSALITIIYLKMVADELMRLGIETVC